jgi:hypothetical protein
LFIGYYVWRLDDLLTCKGTCIRHKARKPSGLGRYASGQKRCQVCEEFIDWNGIWCPCCGYRLRTRPRNMKYKTKLLASDFVIQVFYKEPTTTTTT